MHWFQVVSNICWILKLEYYLIFIYFKQSRLRVNLTCVSRLVGMSSQRWRQNTYWTKLCFFSVFWFVTKSKQILGNIRYSNFKIQQIPNLLMKCQRNSKTKTNSKILDITLFLKYGFFMKLHLCQLTISSHQNMVGYLLHPPNFDDWKWSTDKRCIRNEVTS